MKQSDAVQFLYRDLQIVSSHLRLKDYDVLFEEEIREYFPFNENIMAWLRGLYAGEKYSAFDEEKLSVYYEKEHPFLFMRDLAHMNNWSAGMNSAERKDHITGLMFSNTPQYALEATLCLCRPSLIHLQQSQWFDFKQAMTNLEYAGSTEWSLQAWKGCALFYLYFHLSEKGSTLFKNEIEELISPYSKALEMGIYGEDDDLRKECTILNKMLAETQSRTLLDGFSS